MIIRNQYEDYDQIILGQDGHQLMTGNLDPFSKYFDWTIANNKIIKNKEIPETIYLKTDGLPYFVSDIFPLILNPFILISGGSDYSPEINFPIQYKYLLESSKIKFWYMNNMRSKTSKTFSLPGGIAAGKFWDNSTHKEVDEIILKYRDLSPKEKIKDKIFCSFRSRHHNDCGKDMIIRPQVLEIVKKHSEMFDIYPPDSLNFKEYLSTLSRYKYILNPHGNGMDPSPTVWLSLLMNSIPVIYKIPNTISMFEDRDCVIFFDHFEQIANKDLYQEKDSVDFNFLTCEYWASKIKNTTI